MKICGKLFLALLPTASTLASAGYGINLTLQSPLVQETDAGTIISATFLATNTSDSDNTFNINLDLPPEWVSIPFDEPFLDLKKNETKLVWIAIRVPSSALAGQYSIRCSLQGREHPSLLSEASFSVVVLSRNAIETSITEVPKYKMAGESYSIQLHLKNAGNIENSVEIDISDSSRFEILVDSQMIHLKPFEDRQVEIKVKIPKDLTYFQEHFVAISTQIQGAPRSVQHLSTKVDIFPTVSSKPQSYDFLPMKTVLGYGMKNEKKQLFVEQYASGPLDASKKKI